MRENSHFTAIPPKKEVTLNELDRGYIVQGDAGVAFPKILLHNIKIRSLLRLDATDGGGYALVIVFVRYFVLYANHDRTGIIKSIGSPEASAHIFVGELSIVIAEAILIDIEQLEVGLFKISLFREFPTCGASVVCRFPIVKAAILFAIVEVISIAVAGIKIHKVCIFGHPDTATRFDGGISLTLALERLGNFIIVAVFHFLASGKQHCRSDNEGRHFNELELHIFNLLKIVYWMNFSRALFFRAQM